MATDMCGSSLFLALPDDIFSTISRFLCPVDVCSLCLSCRHLNSVLASDKVWLSQCDGLGLVSCQTLSDWRKGVSSYKMLCRFLVNIQPLIGIWVHQNPELGNVVYVMPGFLSVVGCRIIPQEIGPLGVEGNSILWAPVFEIFCSYEGGTSFILHGRERGGEYVYPGLLKSVDRTCNVLLLEVEPRREKDGGNLAHSKSFLHQVETQIHQRLSGSQTGISNSQKVVTQKNAGFPFSRLGFGDRRRLLDVVTSKVKRRVADETNMILFPRLTSSEADSRRDVAFLHERRLLMLQMCTNGDVVNDLSSGQELDVTESTEYTSSSITKGKTLSGFLKNGLKQILGKSSSTNGTEEHQKNTSSSRDGKNVHLHEFLQSGDTVGLTLRATTMKLSSYRAWPNMHDSRFALYKLPIQTPNSDHDFAGLWGGSFGWPSGRMSEDKPINALFVVLISYEESEGQKLLIATKILEGTNYVLHPNGSAMFIVNIGNPSTDPFPWDNDGELNPVDIKQSFDGEGIANGYGFRYPGSKPGSLFVIEDGLVFVWKESRSVLTLRRLDLPELLKRGERVFGLTPVSNFAYLTKTYSNVYSGYSNCASGLSSPRRNNV